MTTLQEYHGKYCTVRLKDDGEAVTYLDNTSTAINAKDFEVIVNQTWSPLTAQDSIIRSDIARTNVEPTVRIRYISNDGVLAANILGTATADKDVDNGADVGRTRGSINDTPAGNLYNFWAWATHPNGSDMIAVKVTNISFTRVPIMVAPENDWIEINLEGTGDQVYTEYDTSS